MYLPPATILSLPVLRRLVPSIARRYAKLFKPRFFVERRLNLLFLIDQLNLIDKSLLNRGSWESRQIQRLFSLSAAQFPDARYTFLDIGSHNGLYSLLFASKAIHPISIIAFEPSPTNYAQLCANVFLNAMTDVISVHKLAVSNTNGLLPLELNSDLNRGGTRISSEPNERTVQVKCCRLDDFLEQSDRRLVVKMDIEGHEVLALQGMRRLLTESLTLLQIEIFEQNYSSVRRLLESFGYREIESIASDYYFTNSRSAL